MAARWQPFELGEPEHLAAAARREFSVRDDYQVLSGTNRADVRRAWDDVVGERDRFTIKAQAEGKRLFEHMFEYAGQVDGENYDAQSGRAFIVETLGQFVE